MTVHDNAAVAAIVSEIWAFSFFVRPSDIYFTGILLLSFFFLSSFVNYPPSSLNRTKRKSATCSSKCNLKMYVQNLGYTLPLKIGG